jgi:phenylpropionate dioxygenase-like ring-hydroxylating dioxygenase large terminal subunit
MVNLSNPSETGTDGTDLERLRSSLFQPHAPGSFYQSLLDTDSVPVPQVMRESNPFEGDLVEIPVSRYTSAEYHDMEVERLWKRVWQMACREDEIPEVGDSIAYEVAGLSFAVVRISPSVVKAYPNACLHRGRKLVDHHHCAVRKSSIRCPFHGFTWDLDGELRSVPAAWDFPGIDPEQWHLPEVSVGLWGGFVFINPDPDAPPLESFLGDIDRHFAKYDLADRWTAARVSKILPCNWKVAQEAFMESLHVIATHPQLLAESSNLDVQYDAWGNYSRAMSPNYVPSAQLGEWPPEQVIMDAALDRRLDGDIQAAVPDGVTARAAAAATMRDRLEPIIGPAKARQLSDAELDDSFFFTVFPNLHPWAAYNQICFRFRPLDRPDRCVHDIYMLRPVIGPRQKAVDLVELSIDEDYTGGTDMGLYLARILNQDLFNLRTFQSGLKSMVKPTVTFATYNESKIRHFHDLLGKWLSEPGPDGG